MEAARSARHRWLRHVAGVGVLAVGLVLMMASRTAAADIDARGTHRASLAKGSYKVRLAAALTLSRTLTDANATALTVALLDDREPTIRRVAVVAVAKACTTPQLDEDVRAAACRALHTAKGDADAKVKKVAYAAAPSAASAKAPAGTGLYVYIPMTKKSAEHAQLVEAIGASLAESSTHFAVDWSSTSPQQADAARQDRRAFRVDVAAARIDVKKMPRGAISLQCSVSMAVAPWNGADKQERWTATDTARITGSARVESGGSRAQAAADCVKALGRDIAKKRLAVFLRSNTPPAGQKTQVAKR